MTIFLFSLSTRGAWATILDCEVGLQFRHTKYDAPYVLLRCPWFGLVVGWNTATFATRDRLVMQDGRIARPPRTAKVWTRKGYTGARFYAV